MHAGGAAAQDFRASHIHFVVPFSAGGLIDSIARLVADDARKTLGQTIIVDNKTGAAGLIGAQFVAQQPADGYQVLFTSPATHTSSASARKVPFDPVAELMPLNALVSIDFLLAAYTEVPPTFAGFVATPRRTDQVHVRLVGPGYDEPSAGQLLGDPRASRVRHIPYRGGAESAQALLRADPAADGIAEAAGAHGAGKLNASLCEAASA